MENRKFYTQEELLDRIYGKIGTPERDKYEADLKEFLEKERIKRANHAKRAQKTVSVKPSKKLVNV